MYSKDICITFSSDCALCVERSKTFFFLMSNVTKHGPVWLHCA